MLLLFDNSASSHRLLFENGVSCPRFYRCWLFLNPPQFNSAHLLVLPLLLLQILQHKMA